MTPPDDQREESLTDLDDRGVEDLAKFDELLRADGDAAQLVARLRRTQHLLHEMGRKQFSGTSDDLDIDIPSVDTDVDAPPRNPTLAETIGKFRLLCELGRGGCGIVFLARDERLDRHVALKLPQPGVLLDESARQRFLQEAKAAAGLDHSNIVPILESGEDGYLCYIASAYCSGPTLAEWIRDRDDPVALPTASRIVAALARAAGHAHEKGILHRDIKPGNVLMFTDETASGIEGDVDQHGDDELIPKLTDFGLAKVISDETKTHTGQMIGTAAYMAPEQAGDTASVGPAADVYALGVVLYEMLTGRTAFQGKNALETLNLARNDDPVPPSRLRAGLPADLEVICLKCLAKNPARRYANGRELADDLRRFLNGEPIRARRSGVVMRFGKWCVRKPVAASLAAVSVLSVVVAIVGFAAATMFFRDAEQKQSAARELAEHRLFEALLARAGKERLGNQPGRRFAALASLAECSDLCRRLGWNDAKRLTLRNEAIASLALVDLEIDVKQSAYPRGSDITGIAVDRRVERYAMFDRGTIVIRRLSDNGIESRITDLGNDRIPEDFRAVLQFSPDGKLLSSSGSRATSRYDAVPRRVWDIATGRIVLNISAENLWPEAEWDFSPDSQTCAMGFPDGSVKLFDLTGAKTARTIVSMGAPVNLIRFDHAGSRIAISRSTPTIEVVEVETGQKVTHVDPVQQATCLAWSPDGRHLAYGDGNRCCVYSLAEKGWISIVKSQSPVVSVAFHPQGHLLATSAYDGKTRLWNPQTSQLLLLADGSSLHFSKDGTRLAFGAIGHKVGRWKVAIADECRVLGKFLLNKDRYCLGFHSGDRLLALATRNGTCLFDVATGRLVKTLPTRNTLLAQFLPGIDQLLVVNDQSIQRWPIKCIVDGGTFRVKTGMPQPVKAPKATFGNSSLSSDGKTVLIEINDPPEASIISLSDESARRLDYQSWDLAMSPDQRWVVATFWHGESYLLNANDLSYHKTLPGRRARAKFSPDGKWLVLGTTTDYWILETKRWSVVKKIERTSAGLSLAMADFSADGRVMAMIDAPGTVQLLNTTTWEKFATLTPASSAVFTSISLSGDAKYLAATTIDGIALAWDLARIRAKLAKLQLDW